MPDISQFIASDNITYDLKDAKAREDLSTETTTISDTSIASFTTKSAQNLTGLTVNIEPVQDLHGYDNPWPAGGGKNLLKLDPTDTTLHGIYVVTNIEVGTVTCSGANDGTTTSKSVGTINNPISTTGFSLQPGDYYFTAGVAGSATTYDMCIWDSTASRYALKWNGTSGAPSMSTNFSQIKIEQDHIYYITVNVRVNYAITGSLVFKPMICLASETDPSFAPYSNICPISGWDGCEVVRTGKNLFLPMASGGASANVKFVRNADFSITFTGKSNGVTRTPTIGSVTLAAGSYVMSGVTGGSENTFGLRVSQYVDGSYVTIDTIYSGETTFTLSEEATIRLIGRFSANQTENFDVTMYPMIRLASETDPSFAPNQKSTYSISFPSSAGTVYGGTLDVTNGLLTVTHGAKRVPEMKSYITSVSPSGETVSFWIYVPGLVIDTSGGTPICDTLKYHQTARISDLLLNEFYWSMSYPNSFFCCMSTALVGTTQDSIWEYLQANPLTVCTMLSTPVTYQLTPTQVTALLGQNNIWADTGDSTVIYRTGKLALLSDIVDSEERVREDLNNKIDSLTAVDVSAAKDSSIAPVEPTSTASTNYAVGDHLMLGGVLYEVTSAIATGETITQGTNITPATVMESVVELDTRLSANIQLASEAASIGIPYEGVDLTVKFASEIAQYTDPWAWIKARITAGDWSGLRIGDYIPFTTTESSPKTYQAQIAGINTYKNYGDTAVGNHIDFICRELWATRHSVNPVKFNNGTKFGDAAATEYPWLASDLYLYLNSLSGKVPNDTTVGGGTGTDVDYTSGGVYYYLPDALKAQIVEKRANLPKRYSASELFSDDNGRGWVNIGKLWLPSEFEVYGASVWGGNGGNSTAGNCVQYSIFSHNMNRVKKRSGSLDNWWILSVYSGKTTDWCSAASSGIAYSTYASSTVVATPICFRIA